MYVHYYYYYSNLFLLLSLLLLLLLLFKQFAIQAICFSGPFSIALLRTKVYHLFYLFVGKQNNTILHFLPEISPQSVLTACITYFLRELFFFFLIIRFVFMLR